MSASAEPAGNSPTRPASPAPNQGGAAGFDLAAAVLAQSPAPTVVVDRAYRHVLFNEAYRSGMSRALGFHVEPGQDFLDSIPDPEERRRIRDRLDRCLAGEGFTVEDTRARGSERFHSEVVYSPIRDARGAVVAVVMEGRDISGRRSIEAALQQRDRLLAEAQQLAHVGSWEWDVAKGALSWSDEVFRIFGLDPATFQPSAEAFEATIHPDDRDDFLRRRGEMLAAKQEACIEHRICRPDGTVRHVQERTRLITDSAGAVTRVTGTVQDITEQREGEAERARLEARLQHAEKMEALGTLAGGVAHDFNNILGGLLAGLSLLEVELGAAAAHHHRDFEQLKAFIQRGSELTKQLLGLGRRGKFDAKPLDLARTVRETASLFQRTHRELTVRLDLADDLRAVLMDESQLEQILLNLLLNASQAMPQGGRVTVAATNCELSEEEARAHGVVAGRFARVQVRDTGVGMSATTKARAFEPFFTTRGPGGGTGLGLASVYGIVRNHGGAVWIDSEPGEGATLTVLLPSTEQPADRTVPAAATARSGHETLLVVDDEPLLVQLTARLLTHLGYEVLSATSGRAALELARAHGDRIALVILDLTMPELSGAQTYDALRPLLPRAKVLLASGFSADEQVRDLLARGCSGFLQKPFDASALTAKVRALREGASPG